LKDDLFYVRHIVDAASKAESYCSGLSKREFASNQLVQDAVIRQLEIAGEAAKHVSADFCRKHPEVPWKEMAGMRDKLIHDYFGVDIEAVWLTVRDDLPKMRPALDKFFSKAR
jgi:uncharacterized protein with HEPN domain